MEILAELLFSLLGWLAEILLQIAFEALAELGLRAVREPFRPAREISPAWATVGYAVFGAIAGGISLLVFPLATITTTWMRIANLAVSPLIAGLAMSLVGAWRRRRGEDLIRLDRFSYGLVFAFAMALVRYFFADVG